MQHNHQDQHASYGEESSNNDADNTPRLTEVIQAKTERYHWGWQVESVIRRLCRLSLHTFGRWTEVELAKHHAEKSRRRAILPPPYPEVIFIAIASSVFLTSIFSSAFLHITERCVKTPLE